MYPHQKMPPPGQTEFDRGELAICGTIVPLSLIQTFAEELHRVPLLIGLLFQDRSNTKITSVTYDTSWQRRIKHFQHRRCTQSCFQGVKCFLAFVIPNKIYILFSESRHRRCNLTKTTNKLTIIITQSKELLNLIEILRYWPLLYNINLATFDSNPILADNVAQKLYTFQQQVALFRFNK